MTEIMTKPAGRKKHPGGRPQKVLRDFNLSSDWKDQIFDLACLGKSETQIRAALTTRWSGKGKRAKPIFSIRAWYQLQERDEEFREVIKITHQLAQAWWENFCQNNIVHSTYQAFETGAWTMNMKNRFGWKDKTDIEHSIADETFEKFREQSNEQLNNRLGSLIKCAN